MTKTIWQNKIQSETQKRFFEEYHDQLSDKTLQLYNKLIGDIEGKTLVVNSRGCLGQVLSVKNKLKSIGVELEIPGDVDRKWESGEDLTTKSVSRIDFQMFLQALPKTPKGDELRLALVLAYTTGMRKSEILELQRGDISIGEDRILILVRGNDKVKDRQFYTDLTLAQELDYFTGFSIDKNYVGSTLLQAMFKTKQHVTFSRLRYTYLNNAISSGVSIGEMKAHVGDFGFISALQYIKTTMADRENKPRQLSFFDSEGVWQHE